MELVTREQWGARPSRAVTTRDLSVVTAAVFHEADVAAPRPNVPDEEAMVRGIQAFHMDTRGWADIAYHVLVGDSGTLYAGRSIQTVGAHCLNFNTPSIGVCFLTNDGVSLAAAAAAVQWVQMAEFVGFHRKLEVFAHREKTSTGCPGDRLAEWVNAVRTAPNPLA